MGELVLPVPVKHSAATRHYEHLKSVQKTLPVLVDKHENITFDAIHENDTKILKKDMEIEETTLETKAALEKIVNKRLPNSLPLQSFDSKFIKYKPSAVSFNERIIRMVEMPVDPLDPPKLKHKRVPKASGSPPVVVMHSPPRPVTLKDQLDWKIPPCISNWKNPKGYMIPRLTVDVKVVQIINDNFAKLSESLYVSEEKAREAVAMRFKVQKEIMTKEEERKEMDLRALAQSARSMETKEEREREKIREERRRERGRKRRQEAKNVAMGKKSKISSDKDRDDVSEKVALGMHASVNSGREVMYDQRLFNQEKGFDSGFATDDQYNVYHNGLLFTAQPTLYRPKRDTYSDMYDEHLDKIMKTHRFKPDKTFPGTSPVEFEKQVEEADPFGLDQFLTKVKIGKNEGGFFNVIMIFPSNYSNSLPTVRFTSELWHPNAYPDSKVCISILHPPGDDPNGYELASERWMPVHTVDSIVLSIISMLLSPNDESANVEAANGEREKRRRLQEKE